MLKTAAGVFILCVCDSITASVPSGSAACVRHRQTISRLPTRSQTSAEQPATLVFRRAEVTSLPAKERNAGELVVLVRRHGDDDSPLEGIFTLEDIFCCFFFTTQFQVKEE